LNNFGKMSKMIETYGFRPSTISESLCTDNPLNDWLYTFGKNNAKRAKMVLPLRNESHKLSERTCVTLDNVAGLCGGVSIANEMSQAMIGTAKANPRDTENPLRVFALEYCLYNSLCYVFVENKDKTTDAFFATKNIDILKQMEKIKHKNLNSFQDHVLGSDYVRCDTNVCVLRLEQGGFAISKKKLNLLNKSIVITPMYLFDMFIEEILNIAKSYELCITYFNGEKEVKLHTSLNSKILKSKLSSNTNIKAILDNCQSYTWYGTMYLPDLDVFGETVIVRVPLARLVQIKKV